MSSTELVTYTPGRNLDVERWKQEGAALITEGVNLSRRARSLQFALGDWMTSGEDAFGEETYQHIEDVIESFPENERPAIQTVKNWAWVARAIPPEIRQPDLSWAHHEVAARIRSNSTQKTLEKRIQWLDHAKAGGWSYREMKDEATKAGAIREPKALSKPTWGEEELCAQCGRLVKEKCA